MFCACSYYADPSFELLDDQRNAGYKIEKNITGTLLTIQLPLFSLKDSTIGSWRMLRPRVLGCDI